MTLHAQACAPMQQSGPVAMPSLDQQTFRLWLHNIYATVKLHRRQPLHSLVSTSHTTLMATYQPCKEFKLYS